MPPPRSCASSAAILIAELLISARRNAVEPWPPSELAMGVRFDHGEEELSEIHEINVTPFIDVILVLLIIFMIVATLASVAILVDLPFVSSLVTQCSDCL